MLRTWGRHRDKVSVLGAVSVSPVARRLGFYCASDPPHVFNAERVVGFLRELLKHLRGPVVVLWDGGSTHQGPARRRSLARHPRLTLERLPAYAPELNPVEAVWSWPKYGRLANFVPAGAAALDDWVIESLVALRHDPTLLRQLWEGTELPFPSP